jgi:anti-sigma factor ChrR (cupin superfamily)
VTCRARRLAAGAALGDLGPGEQQRYAAHRVACPACRGDEAAIGALLADLSPIAPPHAPPASVLAGIRSTIRSEGGRA